jgi:biotin carboxyl carrier protein
MKIEVKIDNQKYTVEIEDIHARPVIARVQGERFEVWPGVSEREDAGQTVLPAVSIPDAEPTASPPAVAQSARSTAVIAPLPGVIVAVLVKPGDSVTRGQELCTLEAMKMKNAIRSSQEGVIEAIAVNVGDQVDHGQVLITFEE